MNVPFCEWLQIRIVENNLQQLSPGRRIGGGAEAEVFETQNPDVVIRIENKVHISSCDKIMMNPQVQETRGVGKIFGQTVVDGKTWTYKERVDPNWATPLNKILKNEGADDNVIKKIYNSLSNLSVVATAGKMYERKPWHQHQTMDEFSSLCQNFKSLSGFIKALSFVPSHDLNSNNYGLTKDGRLVIIDC